jgi:tripartite-type tricarboxylate transporter receptor subunit TctC
MKRSLVAIFLAIACWAAHGANAQPWPAKPARLIVSANPGGGTADPISRFLAEALPEVSASAKAGMPGLATGSWFGILAPVGTPKAFADVWDREITRWGEGARFTGVTLD